MRNLIFLITFSLFFFLDVAIDLHQGIALDHVLHEVILLVIGIVAISWQIRVIRHKNQHIVHLGREILQTKEEYRQWKEKSHNNAKQIRDLIDHQFALWHLSHSEKDVALLLIKGLSMKEIAEIRQTHEKTVRQQSTVIYKKSGLSGRQELAAFFLEDLLSAPE